MVIRQTCKEKTLALELGPRVILSATKGGNYDKNTDWYCGSGHHGWGRRLKIDMVLNWRVICICRKTGTRRHLVRRWVCQTTGLWMQRPGRSIPMCRAVPELTINLSYFNLCCVDISRLNCLISWPMSRNPRKSDPDILMSVILRAMADRLR